MEKFRRTFSFIFNHPLGKKHPVKSMLRFLYWQLQTTVHPHRYIIKTFISPVKFYARKGLTGITGNIYTGLHEFNDMGFVLHFLRPGDVFFDIGSNAGSYTLLASGVCKALTTAIEPIPSTYKILSDNITLNNLHDKVTLVNAGAGDSEGTLDFSSDQDTTNHVISSDETQANIIKVPVVIIDNIIENNVPVLMKIDVEGFEARVLNGMQSLLKNQQLKALIIEMSNNDAYGFTGQFAHNLLTENGFVPLSYHPFTRGLTSPAGNKTDNVIYCRDMDFIADRVNNAKSVKIMGEWI